MSNSQAETREDEPRTETGLDREQRITVTAKRQKLNRVFRSYRKQRTGAAAVEFAVVAPIFLLLVFGMIEYGRMVMVQQILVNASREGARLAVLDGTTRNDVIARVDEYLTSASVQGAVPAQVTPDPETAQFGEPITVTISVDFQQVSWLPSPMYLGGKTLSATTVMRREAVQ